MLQASDIAKDRRVLAYDFDGHGLSPFSGKTELDITDLAQDLIDFLEKLKLETVILLGHSINGVRDPHTLPYGIWLTSASPECIVLLCRPGSMASREAHPSTSGPQPQLGRPRQHAEARCISFFRPRRHVRDSQHRLQVCRLEANSHLLPHGRGVHPASCPEHEPSRIRRCLSCAYHGAEDRCEGVSLQTLHYWRRRRHASYQEISRAVGE